MNCFTGRTSRPGSKKAWPSEAVRRPEEDPARRHFLNPGRLVRPTFFDPGRLVRPVKQFIG